MTYLFDQFELREKDFCLYENGKRIALEPKALQVLLLLLSRAGHLVEKNFLLETVWSNTFVEENNLTRTILVLRRALGDDRHDRIFIETVPTKGYRFVHEVRQVPEEEDLSHTSAVAIEGMPGEEPGIASGTIQEGLPGLSIWRRYLQVAVALVVLTVAVCGWWLYRMHTKAHSPLQPSIAVLPIVNQTGDSGNDYISDGVTESSIRQLSGIADVRVIGAGSVARYKGAQQDVRSVGRTLGVDTVLQGHLLRVDGRLMLVVELCRVSDGSVLLSRDYLLEDKDLLPVQADLVRDTLQTLRVDTGVKSEALTHTNNPMAYEEFLKGEAVAQGDSPAELHEAVQHFEKATAIDPAFDLAWSELAQVHLMLGVYYEAPREHMEIARRDARRALELNHDLEQAHGSLGVIEMVYDWNFAAATSELEPEKSARSAVSSLACMVHLLDQTGRSRKAEEMVRRFLAYDPQSARLISELGCVAYYHRHYDEAVRSYTAAMEIDPKSPLPYWGLGKSLTQLGKYQQAIEVLDSFAKRNGFEPPILTAESGYSLAKWGKKKEARERIEQLVAESHSGFVDPYFIALVHLGLGDKEETFAWLAKAEDARSVFLISTLTDPKWEELLTDPRFGAMVSRMSAKEHA